MVDYFVFDDEGDIYLSFGPLTSESHFPEGEEVIGNEGSVDEEQKEHNTGSLQTVQIRVSSAILKSSSRIFQAMLSNEHFWEAHTLKSKGSVHIQLPGDKHEPFRIVMAIIHQRHVQVPEIVDSKTLARIATIVDKYGFHLAVIKHAQLWVDKLGSEISNGFNDDISLWIWIAWVFRVPTLFRRLTAICQRESEGHDLGSVIDNAQLPQKLIGKDYVSSSVEK
ncbi:hypothetical protein P170DRAFT_478930 [Aspergillus steynii IBT 23096]|uniref:BTB domain-containing protein n=1 Tax=Aspergillus steynii IBT 23096 TaxID=1392250 RepID=A0A2I2FZE6_9EURO|nr:uncharacterized protein P170DRAFT_478930 [Aspergillus steynii IBT 23096]PLB46003.1 hypothetical protein P170DRAFT_478930 [Aspergillus steynii IBT 23096]